MNISFIQTRNLGLLILVTIIIIMGLLSSVTARKIAETLTVITGEETKLEITEKARRSFIDAKDTFIAFTRGETEDVAPAIVLINRTIDETTHLKTLTESEKEKGNIVQFITSVEHFKTAVAAYAEKAIDEAAVDAEKNAILTGKEAQKALHNMIDDIRTHIRSANISALGVIGKSQRVSNTILILGVLTGIFITFFMGLALSRPILKGVSHLTSAAEQILAASQQQATGIEEEAAQINQAAVSAKELAVTAKQVNDLGNEIARSSAGSVQMANGGAKVVSDAVSGMEKIRHSVLETAKKIESLGERSQAITEIVTLIEDIADQTNLLSLNAAIEAARAGEVGKGFAVVADAIGKLADRTTKSTKNISELIKAIQQDTSSCVMSMEESTKETEKGTTLAQEAGKNIKEIVNAFENVAQSAKEINLASRQQMAGSEQVSKAMVGVDQIMRQSADAAKQSAESAKSLANLAEEFKKIIGVTKKKPL